MFAEIYYTKPAVDVSIVKINSAKKAIVEPIAKINSAKLKKTGWENRFRCITLSQIESENMT